MEKDIIERLLEITLSIIRDGGECSEDQIDEIFEIAERYDLKIDEDLYLYED